MEEKLSQNRNQRNITENYFDLVMEILNNNIPSFAARHVSHVMKSSTFTSSCPDLLDKSLKEQ